MKINVVPKYPALAKNAAWQKNKSFKEKLKKATKTGLGERLVAAEKAFGKIKFELLDVKRLQKATGKRLTTLTSLEEAKRKAQQHLDGPVTAAHAAAQAAVVKARATSRNNALALKATFAASAIAQNLESFARTIDPDQFNLDDFDTYKQTTFKDELERASERARVTIKRLLPNLRQAAETVADLPTVVGYKASGFQKQVQAINLALSQSEDPVLQVWGKQHWAWLALPRTQPKGDDAVMDKVNQVLQVLKELEDLTD